MPAKLHESRIALISGQKRSGKTTLALQTARLLAQKNYQIRGLFSKAAFSPQGKLQGFDLLDWQSQQTKPLCRLAAKTQGLQTGRFLFFQETFDWGNQILLSQKDTNLLFLDEIGLLEIQGKGWAKTARHLLENSQNRMIWVVRHSHLNEIARRFAIGQAPVFLTENSSPKQLCEWAKKTK